MANASKSQGHSPVPAKSPTKANKESKNELIDFYDALKALAGGSKITKEEWGDIAIYCLLRNSRAQIFLTDGLFHDWIISDGDLAGEDWFVLR